MKNTLLLNWMIVYRFKRQRISEEKVKEWES